MIILHSRPRPGYTLIELATVLAMLGLALAVAVPVLGRSVDGLKVRTARDIVAVELARTRLLARAHGGAIAVLDSEAGATWVESVTGDTIALPVPVTAQHDVRIDLDGEAVARVEYDRFGIGRLANRTIRLVRNDAEARVTISAYGRVRSW